MNQQVRPNFLIVGAPKSGTSSLYEYLRQHPEIAMSKKKEPTHFVPGFVHGVQDFNAYLDLFREASGKKAIGEASTAYLYCEESPGWIKSVLGDIKVIILLRNPAKRAFSLYSWMVMEGYENARTFEEALAREPLRVQDSYFRDHNPEAFADYLYFNSGLYFDQVKRYLDIFGKENVRVYLFEDFIKDPLVVCRDIFDFLNVDKEFLPVITVLNESNIPYSITLQFWLRTIRGKRWCPSRVNQELWTLNKRWGKKTEISPLLYESLMQRYQPDIFELEKLLGWDLSTWYTTR